jgi:hypothetical protein
MGDQKTRAFTVGDAAYGLGGVILGFVIGFFITNALERERLTAPSAAGTAQVTDQLPPGHPPIDPTTRMTGRIPPPLPSLEPRRASGQTAEQAYKNIKVLRGIPATEIMPIMEIFNQSLGVECTYCHIPNAYDREDHPLKETSRRMIEMVREINRSFLGGKINCYTCHRGAPKPPTQ